MPYDATVYERDPRPYVNRSTHTARKMTRAHFEAIAETLKELRPDRGNKFAPRSVRTKGGAAYAQWEHTVRALGDMCERSNPAFRRVAFERACGIEE